MRLLHVSHQYRPAIGGAEAYITDLSEELVARGHQVDVFTSRSLDYHTWRSELPRREHLAGVDVHRFSSLPRNGSAWRALDYGFGHYWASGARRYEPYIFYGNGPLCPMLFGAILRSAQRYDLMHISHLHYSHAYTAYVAARLRHLPVVLTPHLHVEQRSTHDVGYMRAVLQGSDAVLAVSQAEGDYLLSHGLGREVAVAGNGLRLERFPPLDVVRSRARFGIPEQAFVVLFLGRKTEYKGLDTCLEAFRALRRQRPNVVLLAAGPETDYSQRLWSDAGAVEGLIVRGALSEEDKLAALAASDVLAVPSSGEAFGIVYLEAWAYCKPVIGARIAAVASIIRDEQDGFLVEPGQAGQLQQRLLDLADRPNLARTLGEQGRRRLEQRYTVSRIADVVEGLCLRTVRRRHTVTHKER